MNVLQLFFELARRLKPFRRVFIILIVLFCLMAIMGLFASSAVSPSLFLQLGLSGTLWSALLLATIDIFHSLPAVPDPNAAWFQRVKRRLIRFLYAMIAVLMLFSTAVLVSTSIKLFTV